MTAVDRSELRTQSGTGGFPFQQPKHLGFGVGFWRDTFGAEWLPQLDIINSGLNSVEIAGV